jgi:hypothetical protein
MTSQNSPSKPPVKPTENPTETVPERRKLKPEAILANVFGDLIKFSKKSPLIMAPFRKYDALAVHFAGQTREERLLVFGFMFGLSLTAHARRTKNQDQRKKMFDLKNQLFIALANKGEFRRVINFRILQNKRFKVTKYCSECSAKNTESKVPSRQWKYCSNCTVDRNFYDVLSMYHKFDEGGASLFLGNELLHEVRALRNVKRMPFGLVEEQVTFKKYTYSPKTLVALDYKSCEAAATKILDLLGKFGTELSPDLQTDHSAAAYFQKGAGSLARKPFAPAQFKPRANSKIQVKPSTVTETEPAHSGPSRITPKAPKSPADENDS